MTKTEVRLKRVFLLALALVLFAGSLMAQAAQADPGISATQTADPATVGQPYAFIVTVTNNSVPQHVGLKDFLPPGMELVSATPSQGSCGMSHHGGVECTLGELPSGGSATVEIVVTPMVSGIMTNTVVSGGEFAPENSEPTTITVSPASASG